MAAEFSRDWHIIAPDLRGHGDSDWSTDGNYSLLALVHDFARLATHVDSWPLTIVAHSLGGNIALRYAGLYPEKVRKVVSIEGLGLPPKMMAQREAIDVHERTRVWINEVDALSAKAQRAYRSFDHALQRMKEANPNLSDAQIHHLTLHGVRQNDDKTCRWKFDPCVRPIFPIDLTPNDVSKLWAAITCPVLLCYGQDSWASNPAEDGRARHFKHAEVQIFPNAGHWVHHDRFDLFVAALKRFL